MSGRSTNRAFAIALATVTFTAAGTANATSSCKATFNRQASLAALPHGANDTRVNAPTSGTFAPAYLEPCTSPSGTSFSIRAEEDQSNVPWSAGNFYRMYHLGYEDTTCFNGIATSACGANDSKIPNTCTSTCVESTLQHRYMTPHLPDGYLQVSVTPPPAFPYCISKLTGATVASNDANATCVTYTGQLFAPVSMKVNGLVSTSTVKVHLYWVDKVATGSGSATRYSLVKKTTTLNNIPLGTKTFNNYAVKYYKMAITGTAALGGWNINDVLLTTI